MDPADCALPNFLDSPIKYVSHTLTTQTQRWTGTEKQPLDNLSHVGPQNQHTETACSRVVMILPDSTITCHNSSKVKGQNSCRGTCTDKTYFKLNI